MSETVHYKGTINKVVIPTGKTTEQVISEILKSKGIKMASYYKDVIECLTDECYREYFYYRKTETLYKIHNEELDPYNDIILANENPDGSISYELKYYNGGAGFDECLEEALNKLK